MEKILILLFVTSSVIFAESISKFRIPSTEKINIVGKFGDGEKSCGRIIPFEHSVSNCDGNFCKYLRQGFSKIVSSENSIGSQEFIILNFKDRIEAERKFKEGYFIKAIKGELIDRAVGSLKYFDEEEEKFISYYNSPILEIEKIYWENNREKCNDAKQFWNQTINEKLKITGIFSKKIYRYNENIGLTVEIQNISDQDISIKSIFFNGLTIRSIDNNGIFMTGTVCYNSQSNTILKSKEKINLYANVSNRLNFYTKEQIFGKELIRKPVKFKVGFRISIDPYGNFSGKEVPFALIN